jgi:hypothetical protein
MNIGGRYCLEDKGKAFVGRDRASKKISVSQLIPGILRQGQPAQDAQAGKHCHSGEHGRYAIMIGKPPQQRCKGSADRRTKSENDSGN